MATNALKWANKSDVEQISMFIAICYIPLFFLRFYWGPESTPNPKSVRGYYFVSRNIRPEAQHVQQTSILNLYISGISKTWLQLIFKIDGLYLFRRIEWYEALRNKKGTLKLGMLLKVYSKITLAKKTS
jgi:hypothetical protein